MCLGIGISEYARVADASVDGVIGSVPEVSRSISSSIMDTCNCASSSSSGSSSLNLCTYVLFLIFNQDTCISTYMYRYPG